TVDLDLGARPFAEQDAVADLDVERNELAGLVAGAWANADDLAFLRLLLGGVRNNDAAGRLRLGFNPANDHAVVQRTEFHRVCFLSYGAPVRDAPRLDGSPGTRLCRV